MIEISFFDVFSMSFFGSCQKAAQKAATFNFGDVLIESVFFDRATFSISAALRNSIMRLSAHYILSPTKITKNNFFRR